MSYPIASSGQFGGEASAIVRKLQDFGLDRSVPIGLVARFVGRTQDEIRDSLVALEARKVIRIDESAETVTLIR